MLEQKIIYTKTLQGQLYNLEIQTIELEAQYLALKFNDLTDWIVQQAQTQPPYLILNFRQMTELTPQDMSNLVQLLNLVSEWNGLLACCEMTQKIHQDCKEWQIASLLNIQVNETKAWEALMALIYFPKKTKPLIERL